MERTSTVSELPQKGKRAVGVIVKLSTIKIAPSIPLTPALVDAKLWVSLKGGLGLGLR